MEEKCNNVNSVGILLSFSSFLHFGLQFDHNNVIFKNLNIMIPSYVKKKKLKHKRCVIKLSCSSYDCL